MTTPLTIVARGEAEVIVTRTLNAPRHLVFEALTVPSLLKRWLLGPDGWTMVVCEIDLRVGGAYRWVWRREDGTEMGMGGVYTEIDAPNRICTRERFDEDWTNGETINTLTLVEEAGRTTLTTNIIYSSTETRDAALNSGMAGGMEAGYARLDTIFAGSFAREDAQ